MNEPEVSRLDKCIQAIKLGFKYNPETGEITTPTGKIAVKKVNEYTCLTVYISGKRYYLYAHQFAWYWVYNETVYCLDHINTIKTDNRICNLRSVTRSQNASNMKKNVGAYFDNRYRKWVSYIMLNYKKKQLGVFSTKAEALKCYRENKNKYHKF